MATLAPSCSRPGRKPCRAMPTCARPPTNAAALPSFDSIHPSAWNRNSRKFTCKILRSPDPCGVGCLGDKRRVEKSTEGGIVKLNDWIDETVEVQFVTRGEDGEPQTITGSLESVGDRGLMLYYDDTPRGRVVFYPWHRIERVEKLD